MPDRTNDEIPELIEDQPEVAHDEEQEPEPSDLER
jgi:hypothetical protein